MEPFIFGQRNGIHILDLQQTVLYWHARLKQCAIRLPKVAGYYLLAQSASLQIKSQKPPAIVVSIM